jgi:hypothetical protein
MSVLAGFTVTGGFDFEGGGVACNYSSPTIMYNTIEGNAVDSPYGDGEGGGISCFESSPKIVFNRIRGNYADIGGGIWVTTHSDPIVANNVISENVSALAGGIAAWWYSDPRITGNIISNNLANGDSGLQANGGGMFCWWYSSPELAYNIISGNQAGNVGGGIAFSSHSFSSMTNCTIVGNIADSQGGGILCVNSTVTVGNMILWNNSAPEGTEIWIGTEPSTLTISYSDVEGGLTSVFVESGSTLNWGDGMIDADPLFVS